jgi:alpha-2-macroglobulin-like protein
MKISPKKLISTGLLAGAGLLVLLLATAAGGSFPTKLNPFITNLQTKLEKYNEHAPEDRVYLQFDKPFYNPGDDVWFSAYVRDAKTMLKSTKSDILYVDFINPKGNVSQKMKLVAHEGIAKGDFHLDNEMLGGMYKVRAYTKWQENNKDGFVFEKELQIQNVVLPNLKMKLDFDRKAVGAGDEVVASLDLQSNDNQPLRNHAFTYKVSLDGNSYIDLKGTTDDAGKAKLKFTLPAKLETNDGLVNVMIAYNGLTESISRSVPIVLNKIDLQFFPEGGDLVYSLGSKVAFRAINEFGKPADIEGMVVDQNGAKIADFKSFHQGMGAFAFNPAPGQTFKAKITKPEGISQTYELPEPMPRGYILNVDHVDSKEMAVVIRSTESEALSLVAQVRGEVYWASQVDVLPGKTEVNIPLSAFPMGVAQVTLFDAKGIQRCERLAFVNRDRQLKVELKTDKEKYLPREKVKMTVKVTDERGMPMPAQLSLAVVNDQMLTFADDKSGTILSQLLLEPDLKSKVDEPRFYFDAKEAKSLAAMDYLMLTSGWRRFAWEQVLGGNMPMLVNQGERALVRGTVYDANTGLPLPHASITAPNSKVAQLTDKEGRFAIDQLDLGLDNSLIVSADKYQEQRPGVADYSQNVTVYLYPANQYRQMPMGAVEDDGWDDMGGAEAEEVQVLGNVRMEVAAAPKPRALAVPVQRMNAPAGGKNNMKAGEGKAMAKEAMRAPVATKGVQVNEVLNKADFKKDIAMDDDGIEPQPRDRDPKQKGDPKADHIAAVTEEDELNGELMDIVVADNRAGLILMEDQKAIQIQQQQAQYYRARQFAAPVYAGAAYVAPDKRSDFRQTIFWEPNVKVDRTGKSVLEFYNSDEISSFRAIAEGISVDGAVGRADMVFYTQLPFSMQARVPVEVATGDQMVVPVVLKNNTDAALSGSLHVIAPDGLEPLMATGSVISIPAGMAQTVNLAYKVKHHPGEGVFNIAFAGAGHTDAFEQKLKIVPQGFPVALSFAGRENDKTFKFGISDVVPGSISASFTAFPSVVTDLVKGIESILREPYGCFEQTSTSSYPNAMVMSYMKEQKEVDGAIMKRASDLLSSGYKRLTTFETKEKGYEWFGAAPGHEALTAYGLMQFNDYSKVMDGVDQGMIQRTSDWLMSRRDGKGGFQRSGKAIDQFGYADQDVTNAYVVYALSEANNKDILPEANACFDVAIKDKDPYQLALVANAMFNLNQIAKGQQALVAMMGTQKADGTFTGTKGSITRSGGISLTVETTSLAVLAMIKSGKADPKGLETAVQSIVSARSGAGGFGSTQGTILGLKAMVEYTKYAKKTDESGIVEIYVDGKKVAEQAYEAGRREAVEIKGLEAYLGQGQHSLEVKYKGVKNPLPYSVAVDYNTNLPNSHKDCVVGLTTKLSATQVSMGSTVRLSATLTNRTKEGQPMTMAIIGLPAGLSAQPWQLKEMVEKKVVDFYEITGNNVVCYYRQMAPGEVRNINLDLKAEIPGQYTAPASSAYLYYTAEYKDWVGLPAVTITN